MEERNVVNGLKYGLTRISSIGGGDLLATTTLIGAATAHHINWCSHRTCYTTAVAVLDVR